MPNHVRNNSITHQRNRNGGSFGQVIDHFKNSNHQISNFSDHTTNKSNYEFNDNDDESEETTPVARTPPVPKPRAKKREPILIPNKINFNMSGLVANNENNFRLKKRSNLNATTTTTSTLANRPITPRIGPLVPPRGDLTAYTTSRNFDGDEDDCS